MYQHFLEGIEQFLDENEDLEQLIREKLQFADTDIMRLANAQMRMCQYARSKTPLPPEEGTPGRVQISVYELAHALHAWKRQIHLHIAHTRGTQSTARAQHWRLYEHCQRRQSAWTT